MCEKKKKTFENILPLAPTKWNCAVIFWVDVKTQLGVKIGMFQTRPQNTQVCTHGKGQWYICSLGGIHDANSMWRWVAIKVITKERTHTVVITGAIWSLVVALNGVAHQLWRPQGWRRWCLCAMVVLLAVKFPFSPICFLFFCVFLPFWHLMPFCLSEAKFIGLRNNGWQRSVGLYTKPPRCKAQRYLGEIDTLRCHLLFLLE